MTTRKALAEIAVDPKRGWLLPRFGGQPLRYQAWAHFEKDPTWGAATWTLLVELAGAPAPCADRVEATVRFVAPGAPQAVLEEGARFELFMGQVHYTHGRITRLLPEDNVAEPGASPNGGPAKPFGNSEVSGGPPSVS